MKINFMATLGKTLTNSKRNTVLQIHIAARKRVFAEPRSLQSFLNIHSEIHHVGNELCVRLRLIETAHNSERNPFLPVAHETRNDRMQRPLVTGELIRRIGIKTEKPSAILQSETGAVGHQARAKLSIVALNKGNHVAVAVGDGQVGGVAARRKRRPGGQSLEH